MDLQRLVDERPGVVLRHAAELFRILGKSSQESGALASAFLHARKHLTATQKALVSELAFSALRNKTLVEHCAAEALRAAAPGRWTEADSPRFCVLAALLLENPSAHFDLVFDDSRRTDTGTGAPFENEAPGFLPLVAAVASEMGGMDSGTPMRAMESAIRLCREESRLHADQLMTDSEMRRRIAGCLSVPEWIVARWACSMTPEDIRSLAAELGKPAAVDLRVNLTRCGRDEAMTVLAGEGIMVDPTPWSPAGLRLRTRAPLQGTTAYRAGMIEVQDEGSQLIALALAPESGWHLLDACAGAGGKTLHLADLQHDTGEIEARDIDGRKLRVLRQRAARCGFRSISVARFPADDSRTGKTPKSGRQNATRRFDAVLVDAPCSGLGTARRAPMMKWRLTPRMLERLTTAQRSILESAAMDVRPDGILVYSTCSLMREENEDVVNGFLDAHPEFRPDDLHEALRVQGIRLPGLMEGGWHVSLRPDTHRTDGFFISRLRRVE